MVLSPQSLILQNIMRYQTTALLYILLFIYFPIPMFFEVINTAYNI